jgi:hypothetical protein
MRLSAKRQMTAAKRERERMVRERRERKQAKRREKRVASLDREDGVVVQDEAT